MYLKEEYKYFKEYSHYDPNYDPPLAATKTVKKCEAVFEIPQQLPNTNVLNLDPGSFAGRPSAPKNLMARRGETVGS